MSFRLTEQQHDAIQYFNQVTPTNPLVVEARAGTGKGLREDQPVVTPNGMVSIGSLKVGDLVCGTDGKAYPVARIHDRGVLQLHKVSFNDGQSVITDSDHLWSCQTKYERDHAKGMIIRTTSDLISLGKNVFLPMPIPVCGTSVNLPIDPWLLGALLGDGGIKDSCIRFTNHESRMIDAVRASIPSDTLLNQIDEMGWRIVGNGYKGGQWRDNTLLNSLRGLCLHGCGSSEKFIPEIYLNSPPEVRLEVLRGLLDTDGHTSKNTLEYCTASSMLAEGVRRIVESVGGLCSMAIRGSHYMKDGIRVECKQSYRLHIRLPSNIMPFKHCGHKVDAFIPKSKYPPVRQIVSIEYAGHGKSVCIEVDSPDHLFMTVGHAVTHNSTLIEHGCRDNLQSRILLLCFNKSIAEAAVNRMPANVTAKTFSGWTWNTPLSTTLPSGIQVDSTYGRVYGHRVKWRFDAKKLANLFRVEPSLIYAARATLDFFVSTADTYITKYHVPKRLWMGKEKQEQEGFKEEVMGISRRIWRMKLEKSNKLVPTTWSDITKMVQIERDIQRTDDYEFVIVDEAQDITACVLDLILQKGSPTILVGDSLQKLYNYLYMIDAMEKVGGKKKYLTESQRFDQLLADAANSVLDLLQGGFPKIVGSGPKTSIRYEAPVGKYTTLCRTNMGLLSEALSEIRKGKKIHVMGNIMDAVKQLESG